MYFIYYIHIHTYVHIIYVCTINGILCTNSGGINITFIGTLLDVIEDPTMTVNITNDTSGRIISNYTTVSIIHMQWKVDYLNTKYDCSIRIFCQLAYALLE